MITLFLLYTNVMYALFTGHGWMQGDLDHFVIATIIGIITAAIECFLIGDLK